MAGNENDDGDGLDGRRGRRMKHRSDSRKLDRPSDGSKRADGPGIEERLREPVGDYVRHQRREHPEHEYDRNAYTTVYDGSRDHGTDKPEDRRRRRRRRHHSQEETDPEAEPLIQDRQDDRLQGEVSVENRHQRPGLMSHLMKCARLALRAQHEDFAKDSPYRVEVLKEAALISRPVLAEVRQRLDEHERDRKGEKKFDPKMIIFKGGLKWIEKKVEDAERDVEKVERRQRRARKSRRTQERVEAQGRHATEGVHEVERDNERSWRVEDGEEVPEAQEAAGFENRPDFQQGRAGDNVFDEARHVAHSGRQSKHGPQGHKRRVRPQPEHPRPHQSRAAHPPRTHDQLTKERKQSAVHEHPLSAPESSHHSRHSSARGQTSHHQHAEGGDDEHVQSAAREKRSSHEEQVVLQRQEDTGDGLAADYYNSFGPNAVPAQSNLTQNTHTTLRPEDSWSFGALRRHDSDSSLSGKADVGAHSATSTARDEGEGKGRQRRHGRASSSKH